MAQNLILQPSDPKHFLDTIKGQFRLRLFVRFLQNQTFGNSAASMKANLCECGG